MRNQDAVADVPMPMRRIVALVAAALAAGLVLVSCGSSSPSARSAPTTTAAPVRPPRLHLRDESAGAGIASRPAIYPERPTTYELDQPLPDLGADAVVRRLVSHAVTESDVRDLSLALRLGNGTIARTESGFTVSDGDATLTVSTADGNTYVSYGLGGPGSVGVSSGGSTGGGEASAPPPAPNVPPTPTTTTTATEAADVPDATEVESIARALLDRMGVLGTEQWAVDVADSGGVAVSCPVGVPCPTVPPVVYDRTATLQRVLDGVKVGGADWSVTVGAQGRVQAVSGTWAAAEVVGRYPLRSASDVFADLKAGRSRAVGPQPMTAVQEAAPALPSSPLNAVVVHVTGVSLGAAQWDAFDGTKVHVDIVPTYRFHVRAEDGGSTYDIEVLALDPTMFDVTPPPPSQPKNVPQPAPAGLPTEERGAPAPG